MSDDSKELSRVEDILSGEDYIPTKPMSRIEKLLLEGGGPGGKLPEVTSDDNGKILKVKDGAWDKGEDISGDKLPQVSSSDNGKVLKVVQGEWNIDEDEGDRLPTVTSADEGKVLKVKNGAWDKDVPEKELPETTSEDSGKALMINDNGDWAKSDIPDPAITAEASGNIASFSDGSNLPMPKLQVGIEPQQDLHGYDAPWVGGAGKNKLPSPAEQTINGVTLTHLSDGSIKLTGTPTANIYFDCFAGTFDSTAYVGYRFKVSYIGSSSGISFRISGSNRASMQDLYDNSVIADNGSGLYFALRVAFDATIPSSGIIIYPMLLSSSETNYDFAPYSNICHISGWDDVNVTRCGKNLFDKTHYKFVKSGYINSGGAWEGSTTILSYPTDSLSGYWNSPMIDIEPFRGMTLSYSGFVSVAGTARGIVDKDFNVLATLGNSEVASNTVDLSQYPTAKYLVLTFIASDYNFDNAQLEIGTTATTYEPYNGQTYNVEFKDGSNPLTVYGGTLDVVSGVLTVDRKTYTLTGSESWRALGTGFGTGTGLSDIGTFDQNKNIAICSHFTKYNTYDWNISNGYFNIADKFIAIRDDTNFDSVEDCVSYVTAQYNNNTPITICAKLTTPLTIQLTPTQVKSLLGSNNVWADTGEIESLIYYKQNAEDIADLIETLVPEELPAITPADNDKILTAYGGEWVPKTNPLPDARNYEAGSVLTVRNNHWSPELLPATPGVPRVESDDVGKVLKATGVDTYDWANGTDIIQTTQESYDAMSDSQKMNGKLYFVHNESDDEDAAIYFMNKCYGKAAKPYVELTQAEYDALPSSKESDGIIYFING